MRAIVIVAALASHAAAEPTLELTVEGAQVHARVRGAAKASPVVLRDMVDDKHAEVTASSVRGFLDRPVAVAFVLHGTQLLGHSDYTDDEWDGYPDYYRPLRDAFDHIALGPRMPAKSEAILIAYASTAEIKKPWADAASFDGEALGRAIDYKGRMGNALVAGVELAISELAPKKDASKLVVIIGDGNDTNNDVGRASLARLAREHPEIAFASLIVKQPLSSEAEIVSELNGVVTEVDDVVLDAPLQRLIERATARFDATFELAAFPHDGKVHRFAFLVGGEHLTSATLEMPPPPPVPAPSNIWRYLVVLGVLAAFGLVSFVMFRPKGR